MMKYSIITPVYNRQDCIARCMDSVIRQLSSIISIEHVIVDDGSKDKTPNIVKKYAESYSHIKFIPFPSNRGTNAARNAAIAAASGDYCILLDSDDYFTDDAMSIVDKYVSSTSYKEYAFVPDDMVKTFSNCQLVANVETKVIEFSDFLGRKLDGDLIHCIRREILQKFPFEEKFFIYEGQFILLYNREAKQTLFVNKVITIRERSRQDSVTRVAICDSTESITKRYNANTRELHTFREDYIQYRQFDYYNSLRLQIIRNGLLLGFYNDIKKELFSADLPLTKVSILYKVMYYTRTGWLAKIALIGYLTIKYKILNAKL